MFDFKIAMITNTFSMHYSSRLLDQNELTYQLDRNLGLRLLHVHQQWLNSGYHEINQHLTFDVKIILKNKIT